MEFLFYGRVGKMSYDEEFEAPDAGAAIEEARDRLKKYRNAEGEDAPFLARLFCGVSLVWAVGNYRTPGGEQHSVPL